MQIDETEENNYDISYLIVTDTLNVVCNRANEIFMIKELILYNSKFAIYVFNNILSLMFMPNPEN